MGPKLSNKRKYADMEAPVFDEAMDISEEEKAQLDQDALSRQIAVFDFKGSVRITAARVFISGLGPLGMEIAKNICRAGVKGVTIHDTKPTTTIDLGGQFYLSEASLGSNRAEATLPLLKALNPTVTVEACTANLLEKQEVLDEHNVVVLCDTMLDDSVKVGEYCRSKGIKLLVADVRGPFAWTFADFGEGFTTYDKDGEPVKEVMLHDITSANPGVVSTVLLDKDRNVHKRHDLEDGDYVTFRDAAGMEALEGAHHQIKVIDPFKFSIGDTSGLGPYTGGATAVQAKVSTAVRFKPLQESMAAPEFMIPDFFKAEFQWPPMLMHVAMQALAAFQRNHAGELPRSWNIEDADEVVAEAQKIHQAVSEDLKIAEIESKLGPVKLLAFTARAHLAPLCAAHGGFVAQEVLKAIMQKFTPLQQWMYVGVEEAIPVDISSPVEASDFAPRGDRTDAQVLCLGRKLSDKLAALKIFMVGAGAIGCELLKNLAMLNVSTAEGGLVTVTDPDIIEKSNLNRQFLFSAEDIGKPKSETAGTASQRMNPGFKVEAHLDKVCPDTQSKFNDDFIGALDCTLNALDNVAARRYVDARCVQLQKPLVDSGTAGTKGHVQVVMPFKTESYGSQEDPPDDSFMVCTIKAFPSEIAHCIQWAKEGFHSKFCEAPQEIQKLLEGGEESFRSNVDASRNANMVKLLKTVHKYLTVRPSSFEDCVRMARVKFEKVYNHRIRQLLLVHPADKMDGDRLFWTLPRRLPTPASFNPEDPTHTDFLTALAMLYSKMFGIQPGDTSPGHIAEAAATASVPEFVPKGTQKHEYDESLTDEQRKKMEEESVSMDEISSLVDSIAGSIQGSFLSQLVADEFEKDDDSNYHIAYITAASNLRARCYGIKEVDFFRTKIVAGKIIPAIATTTSLVSALVVVELVKIVQDVDVALLKNCFLNLALPVMQMSEPFPPQFKDLGNGVKFSEWDRWEVNLGGTVTLDQFIEHFKAEFGGLDVQGIFHGGKTVYMASMPTHASRRKKKMHELPGIKLKLGQVPYVDLVVAFVDAEGEAIDKNPPVR